MFKFSYIDVQFPTLSSPLTRAAELTLSHARYEHETATIYFTNWDPTYETLSPGTPVIVTLTGGKSSETYNMYVNYIKPDLSPSKKYLEVNLIGASFPLKQQSQRVWSDVTADRVAADIAKSHNFSYVAVPHPRVYEQVTQAGKTDWELLVSLAKQSGYSVSAVNTSLYFQPLTKSFTENRAVAHYFTMTNLSSKATEIYSFVPLIGESIPFQDAQKATVSISGINPRNKTLHSHKGAKASRYTRARGTEPVFNSYNTSVVAPSFEISKHETDAAVARNRYPYRGKVVVVGTPGIRPDDAVFLANIGQSYSGYWTVLKVEHEIENNRQFVTTLHVGTDSLGLAGSWDGEAPVTAPNEKVSRVLSPSKRKNNKIPATKLAKTGRGNKQSLTNHFSLSSKAKSAKTAGASYKWEGTPVNLEKPAVIEKSMPGVVRVKKRSSRG